MERIQVVDAQRKIKRDIQKVFGDNFLKIITEIILNCDDSYNRLDKEKKSKISLITIWLNRKKRTMMIVDEAEGISFEKMKEIFSHYGGDYNGADEANNVRGLFGQGASDVLFLSSFHGYRSSIVSIKNGKASQCDFYFDGRKEISVHNADDDINNLRKKTGIQNNGTIVYFGLPKNVKIPKQNTIKNTIESFYMLRYILSDKSKQVLLYDGDLMHRLSSVKLIPKKEKIIVSKKAIKLNFDGKNIKSTLMVYEKKPNEPQKIIIKDQNNIVYDETLFGLEKVHGANYIAGEYTIEGIYDILKDKLNSEQPEEILRDSRDGFDKRHRFTSGMYDKVSTVLYKIIDEMNEARESVAVSLNNNKKLLSALKKINSYFNELELSNITGINKGENPPIDGIRFARPIISITKGKLYGLQMYINTSMIKSGETILFDMENNKCITLMTNSISYQEKDKTYNNLVIKTMIIKAEQVTTTPIKITAYINGYKTTVLINVIKEKVIYPLNGLEFKPKRKEISPGKSSSFMLYFDTEYIPFNSTITTKLSYESMLFPETKQYTITKSHLITDTIGKIKISFKAHDYDEKIIVNANFNNILAEAVCYVKEKKKDDDGTEGILNKLELIFDKNLLAQATVIPSQGILQINGKHIINKTIMGNMGNKDPKNPEFDQKQLKYLYELVALESSKLYVTEKYNKSNRNYDVEEYLNEVQEHKTKLYEGLIES
jgi:hypothetical protein